MAAFTHTLTAALSTFTAVGCTLLLVLLSYSLLANLVSQHRHLIRTNLDAYLRRCKIYAKLTVRANSVGAKGTFVPSSKRWRQQSLLP